MINEEVNQEGVDLNFPPPLDLGGLEDLAQGVDDFVDEEILDDGVQVIADEIAHPENHVAGDEQPQIHDLVEEDVMNNQHMQLGFV